MGNVNVALIFLLSGLKLKTDDVFKAVRSWREMLFSCISILFITPLLGMALINISFDTPELAYGFAIFCTMPTTLSSGVILTGQGKGNIALALLLTVSTNLLGIITLPFMLVAVFSTAADVSVSIDAGKLLVKLLLYILLPLTTGKIIRHTVPCVPRFCTLFKIRLKLLSSFLLIMIPWMSVSKSAEQMKSLTAAEILACFGLGIAIHLIYLGYTYGITRAARIPIRERVAVVILVSQKTLPVALTVIGFLPESLGVAGIIALPCIISHFCQIVMDGYVAAKFAAMIPDDDNDDDHDDDKQHGAKEKEDKGEVEVIDVVL